MSYESIAEAFADYRRLVIPATASHVQIQETQRAFYAGIHFVLLHLLNTVAEDAVSEDEGVVILQRLKEECEAFAATTQATHVESDAPASAVDATNAPQFHEPPDPDIRALLNQLGHRIGEFLPTGWGFTLLLFEMDTTAALFYISNAQRENIISVMKKFINRNTQ